MGAEPGLKEVGRGLGKAEKGWWEEERVLEEVGMGAGSGAEGASVAGAAVHLASRRAGKIESWPQGPWRH